MRALDKSIVSKGDSHRFTKLLVCCLLLQARLLLPVSATAVDQTCTVTLYDSLENGCWHHRDILDINLEETIFHDYPCDGSASNNQTFECCVNITAQENSDVRDNLGKAAENATHAHFACEKTESAGEVTYLYDVWWELAVAVAILIAAILISCRVVRCLRRKRSDGHETMQGREGRVPEIL